MQQYKEIEINTNQSLSKVIEEMKAAEKELLNQGFSDISTYIGYGEDFYVIGYKKDKTS